MADTVTPGIYRIVNAKVPGLCLDVAHSDMRNGANVLVWEVLYVTNQFFSLTYRKDGTAQILSLHSGKSIDVEGGNIASGTNVLQWTDTDARNQQWVIESDSGSMVFDGVTYPTYAIRPAANQQLALDAAGSDPVMGANVSVYSENGGRNQRWAFVPMPLFASGGIYEIRSMLKTSMAIDVSGASAARGANVVIWGAHGGNNQKFLITEEESGKWSVMGISSNKYVDVEGGAASNGKNVCQWDDNDQRNQRWRITEYGTTTIDGQECAVVSFGSYAADDGRNYLIDVDHGLTTNNANVLVWQDNGGYNQRYALVRTDPQDTDLPVPVGVEWATEVGGEGVGLTNDEAETLYPTFLTTDKWAADGPNSFEWRYRSHSMAAGSSTWGAWGQWAEWLPAPTRVDGQRRWISSGLPAMCGESEKALQYEVQIRAVAVNDDDVRTHGIASDTTLTVLPEPDVTFTVAGFGPEGMRLAYESDYLSGTTNILIESASVDGGPSMRESMYFPALDESGSILIPVTEFSAWPQDGATLNVAYRVGTDQMPTFDTKYSVPLTVSYNTGSGMEATPEISVGEGRSLLVTVPEANVTNAWLVSDGKMTEMRVEGNTAYIYAPFGTEKDYEVYVALRSLDGDRWGVAHVSTGDMTAALADMEPCHAWNWHGGSFLLEVRDGAPLKTDYTVSRNVATHRLNKREWEDVHYAHNKSAAFVAEGCLTDMVDIEGTREKLFAMCDQGYVTYRSPSGLVAEVAVTGFRIEEGAYFTNVTVNMTRTG